MYYIEICVLYRKKNNKYNIAINRVSYLTSKEITVRVVYSELGILLRPWLEIRIGYVSSYK